MTSAAHQQRSATQYQQVVFLIRFLVVTQLRAVKDGVVDQLEQLTATPTNDMGVVHAPTHSDMGIRGGSLHCRHQRKFRKFKFGIGQIAALAD